MVEVSLPIVVGAAVVDSINPCAFGVMIFLLAFLIKNNKKNSKWFLLTHGLAYIFGVYLTYLAAGLVLLPIISKLGAASVLAYKILAVVVIGFGLLEFKEYFFPHLGGPSLKIFPSEAKRIELYVKRVANGIPAAIGLGMFVALVELPCTGAVYLAILTLMSFSGVNFVNVSYLLLYNLIFVLPLVGILMGVYSGISVNKFEAWRKKHKGAMRLIAGTILLIMGVWMLLYIYGLGTG